MSRRILFLCSIFIVVMSAFALRWPLTVVPVHAAAANDKSYSPSYTRNGDLVPPLEYRKWIYLTSGLDMSYLPSNTPDMSMFDNVFVNREAYDSFLANGKWPDKTVLVLEARSASVKGSINKHGHFQSGGVMGIEVHVKDEKRFPGGWAFFDVASETKATLIPLKAPCYSCHQDHGAVDTTFIQFYPTLLPIAENKATLSKSYLKESPAAGK